MATPSFFETDYSTIVKKLDLIDPVQYSATRNYIDGSVTYLSPYISRGVISTRQVLEHVLSKGYTIAESTSLIKELCWRDYFQRVAQVRDVNLPIKYEQSQVQNKEMPARVLNGTTGIEAIDQAIHRMYATGYMHNHCRMYVASVVCNIAKSYWLHPAKWMYYHLLDGDWASNACSWQWVAGLNSSKKYFANQENINQYTKTSQSQTFLDISYESIPFISSPEALTELDTFIAAPGYPESSPIHINHAWPTYIYNYYNLDPLWHKDEPGNRILLIEPDFFDQYPVSKKCMDFMLALSKNMEGIQVYVGSFDSFKTLYHVQNIYYKEHPFNIGYLGYQEARDWIDTEVVGYEPSFFAYWKKVSKNLTK